MSWKRPKWTRELRGTAESGGAFSLWVTPFHITDTHSIHCLHKNIAWCSFKALLFFYFTHNNIDYCKFYMIVIWVIQVDQNARKLDFVHSTGTSSLGLAYAFFPQVLSFRCFGETRLWKPGRCRILMVTRHGCRCCSRSGCLSCHDTFMTAAWSRLTLGALMLMDDPSAAPVPLPPGPFPWSYSQRRGCLDRGPAR